MAQADATASKLEWRVNLLALPLLNPNVGLRINTPHKWKPDFYLGLQVPLFQHLVPLSRTTLVNAFAGEAGWGMTAYGGFTRMEAGWGNGGGRISFQIGTRAYRTGEITYTGLDYRCGSYDLLRVTFGPRVLFAGMARLGKRTGLEFYGGAGLRIGFNRIQVIEVGDDRAGGCVTDPGFVPDSRLGTATRSIVPTVHAGLSLVRW